MSFSRFSKVEHEQYLSVSDADLVRVEHCLVTIVHWLDCHTEQWTGGVIYAHEINLANNRICDEEHTVT